MTEEELTAKLREIEKELAEIKQKRGTVPSPPKPMRVPAYAMPKPPAEPSDLPAVIAAPEGATRKTSPEDWSEANHKLRPFWLALLVVVVCFVIWLFSGWFDRSGAPSGSGSMTLTHRSDDVPGIETVNCDFKDFYAQALTTGIPVDKRFRFVAVVDEDLSIRDLGTSAKSLTGYDAFDDRLQYQEFLKSDTSHARTVVVSMDVSGHVLIHSIK